MRRCARKQTTHPAGLVAGILLFGFIAGLVGTPQVTAQGTVTYVETFEDDVPQLTPNGETATGTEFYTFSTVNGGQGIVRAENANSGNNSVRLSTTGPSSGVVFALNGGDITCGNNDGMVLSFWIDPTAVASGDEFWIGFGDSTDVGAAASPSPFVGVVVDGDTLNAHARSGTSGTAVWIGSGVTANTGLDIAVYITDCDAGIGVIVSNSLDQSLAFDVTGGFSAIDSFIAHTREGTNSGCTCANQWVDDISFGNIAVPAPAPDVQPIDGSVTGLTDVTGFGIDRDGTNVILRHDGGSSVTVYDGASLDVKGTTTTPNCNRDGGVMAFDGGVAYFDCAVSGDPLNLVFRNPSLSGNVVFDSTIPFGSEIDYEDLLTHLSPSTWAGANPQPGLSAFTLAAALTDGRIAAMHIVKGATSLDIASKTASYSTQAADALCTTHNYQHFAASQVAPTLGWFHQDGTFADGTATNSFSQIFTGGSGINQAEDVDCAGGEGGDSPLRIIVAKGGTVTVVNATSGATIWSQTYSDVEAVAISGDKEWCGAVVNDGGRKGYAYNCNNGTNLGQFAVPATTVERLATDRFGQAFWMQTTTGASRATVYPITTVEPAGGSTPDPTAAPTADTPAQNTQNPLGRAIDFSSDAWGFDTSMLFGLTILSMVGLRMAVSGSALLIAAGIFGAFVTCVYLGLFPTWVLIVVVFIIIVMAARTLFGGGRENGGEE